MTQTIKMKNILNRNFNGVKPWEVVNISEELQSIYELNWFRKLEILQKEEKILKDKEQAEKSEKKSKKEAEEKQREEILKKQEELEKQAEKKKKEAEEK